MLHKYDPLYTKKRCTRCLSVMSSNYLGRSQPLESFYLLHVSYFIWHLNLQLSNIIYQIIYGICYCRIRIQSSAMQTKAQKSMKPTSILLPRKTIIRSLTRTFPPSGMRITISHHEWFLTAKFGTLTTQSQMKDEIFLSPTSGIDKSNINKNQIQNIITQMLALCTFKC